MKTNELKEFLDEKVLQYNNSSFLIDDPLCVPHSFDSKEDIEISAFLTATIAWGNRKSIISSANRIMDLLERDPYRFIMDFDPMKSHKLSNFVHRTFNGEDLGYFIRSLQNIYRTYGGMECIFKTHEMENSLQPAISEFKKIFFELPHPARSRKHISDPAKGSAAKRINMFLRWMVRNNTAGVDFGLWKDLTPAQLSCPLDVHSGRVARKLGLLSRKQNDAKAVTELDNRLRCMDPEDPVKYDFALFGLGVFEQF